jgi:nucleotide-binding universal stress UspA family protein
MEKIVVGYDHTRAADGALAWAIDYAGKSGSELVIVCGVSSTWEWELAAIQVNPDPIRHRIGQLIQQDWTAPVCAARVPYRTEVLVGRPAEVLLASARRHHAALIVLGMTGRGTVGELITGSTGREVAHHAVRPIVTVPANRTPPVSEPAPAR